jgi:C4-dicarboxylate transporter DctQ subunit
MVWYGWDVVGTALLLDQRSSTDLQFPIWIYYTALPTGGALMLVRYVIRLVRYAFFFDPRTMSVGHTPSIVHEVGSELALTIHEAAPE